jgi:N-acetylglucosamine-6-sulfatase
MPDALLDYDREQADLRSQHEALMSVDEAVGAIIDALGTRADNTLFVFLSDNGLQFGEHGLNKKYVPYSGSTDVPMLLRWDGTITPGSTYHDAPVTNADLGATVADAAGVSLVDPDGVSFFSPSRPDNVLLEAMDNRDHPSYCGIRTRRYAYIEYDSDAGDELYDYRVDPYELDNKTNDASYDGLEANLRAKAKRACHPRPPGFNWEIRNARN